MAGQRYGVKENSPLNNNNRGNNRRRGRGNNNRPQGGNGGGGGGGQQVNRIDSRARGNAPQLLEKYRKLASDAHLNGDRVTAEYYLQFADHYFRVIADTRVRQEEARLRRDDRWEGGNEPFRDEADDSGEFNMENDFPAFDQPPVYQRRDREERPEPRENAARDNQDRDNGNREGGNRDNGDNANRDNANRDNANRDNGNRQSGNREQPKREWRSRRDAVEDQPVVEPAAAVEPARQVEDAAPANPYEPPENPFLRPNRATRGLRPRRDDGRNPRPARDGEQPAPAVDEAPRAEPEIPALGLDPAMLPPAIGRDSSADADEAPAPRRRARRKPTGGDTDETLQSVG